MPGVSCDNILTYVAQYCQLRSMFEFYDPFHSSYRSIFAGFLLQAVAEGMLSIQSMGEHKWDDWRGKGTCVAAYAN